MINVAICDDETVIIEYLQSIIGKLAMGINERIIIDGFNSSTDLIKMLDNGEKYDLIFLDIQMPEMSGIDVGNYIRNNLNNNITQIIYISGQQEYAMDLFSIRPMDFLIKPLTEDNIRKVFSTAYRLISGNKQMFEYKVREEIHRIELSNIIYFLSDARKIKMVTNNGIIEFYEKMDDLYQRVKDYNFIYIHKSYIVNNIHIEKFRPLSVLMDNGEELPISRGRRGNIRNIWA